MKLVALVLANGFASLFALIPDLVLARAVLLDLGQAFASVHFKYVAFFARDGNNRVEEVGQFLASQCMAKWIAPELLEIQAEFFLVFALD